MDELEKVSVIVPVYNAGKYLDACMNSILTQTYTNIEIIIIDDGSTDNSDEVIKKYKDQDKRIKLISQNRQGVSNARNSGIREASGKYLVFVDADDILPDNSIELRICGLGKNDLLIGNYISVREGKETICNPVCENSIWNQKDAIENVALDREFGYQGYIWNKLYRMDIIKSFHIFFCENLAYNEDKLFNLMYLVHCKTVKIINYYIYHYRIHSDGAMGSLAIISDDSFTKVMSEFKAFDKIFGIVSKFCREFRCDMIVYAYERARIILGVLNDKNTNKIRRALLRQMRIYAFMIVMENIFQIPYGRRKEMLKLMLVGRI